MTRQTYFPKGKGPTSAEVDLVEKAFIDLVQKQDGTLIRHEDIAAAAGIDYAIDQYFRIVRRWIKRMRRENGIVIVSERGMGYKAVPDSGKTEAALEEHRAAARRIRKSGEIVRATERGNLTDGQQKTYDMVAAQTADLLRRSRMLTRTAAADLRGTPRLPEPAKPENERDPRGNAGPEEGGKNQ